MTSPGPAFQEWSESCHENVPAPKMVSSDLRSTNGLTLLARIEIVVVLVYTDRNFVDNFLQVEIYLALVANI